MIEERILEWIDLGDTIQIDIYQKKKLLYFYKYYHLLVKHGIVSEMSEIVFQCIFFLQIISLSAVNIEPNNDIILEILNYLEQIIIPHKILKNKKIYIIFSIVIWSINLFHLILSIKVFILFKKKIIIKIVFFIISILNYIIYYYLIGPILYLALSGTFCSGGIHEILILKCYSDPIHIIIFIINFIFCLYSLFIVETFSLYNYQIGSIYSANIKSRVNSNYDLYSSNGKLIVYFIAYFYRKYAKDIAAFKYIYQIYIFLSCFVLAIYSIKSVFYYNKDINILIHFSWFAETWFALCMLLKIWFNINDITLFVIFGFILIIFVFINQRNYSYYKRITKMDLFTENSLVFIEKFNYEIIDLYKSSKKVDKLLLNGIIKKFEDYIMINPELVEIYNKIKNDDNLQKKFYSLNELSMLALIFTIYNYYLEKSEIKTDISLHMCYFLINKLKNPSFAIYLISKLRNNNHIQLYHKYSLMEKIRHYLIVKLNRKNFKNSINNVQIGSVILYYQCSDLFKIKIYDVTSEQIEYFDTLRNNVNSGKLTENFLKKGENILILRKEIFKIWEKIIELNPFNNEVEADFILYLKTVLQDDILAKEEEKQFNILKTNKINDRNNVYHSMFKTDINSVLLIDGYSLNNKILYATPNFPYIYKLNGKEIINTSIDELLPNVVQHFHKELMDNVLKYSNITTTFNKDFHIYLKGKNNSLFYVYLYLKPVPNLSYGLIYFAFLSKVQDHEFTIILDSNFKIDGFSEMNQGNSFTLNTNAKNNYNLTIQASNHHIGKIIPEIMLELCYKDNIFYVNKNDVDIKGNLYSTTNMKDSEIDRRLNILLDTIKKKGCLDINENYEDGKKNSREYHDLIDEINEKKNKSFSVFFKIETRKFLDDKYRYHIIHVINDNLYLVENTNFINKSLNLHMTVSEYCDENKREDKLLHKGTFNTEEDENDTIIKKSNKNLNVLYNKYLGIKDNNPNDNYKAIKVKIPLNKKIENDNDIQENTEHNKEVNNINNINLNENNKIDYLEHKENSSEFILFGRLKLNIINKRDSIQIIIMKVVSILFVVVVIILVIYDYLFTMNLYKNLVQYLDDNLVFTYSKIISSCIYISSVNIKWLKYKYIDEYSCPVNCSIFYLKTLDKCIKNLRNQKDNMYSYDSDYYQIIMQRKNINLIVYNSDKQDILYVNLNDYLNIIISKGVKLIGAFNEYHNNYGKDRINMENLLSLSLKYFDSDTKGFKGNEKITQVKKKFKNNNTRIIISVIFCATLLVIFLYFIIDFNNLELFFLDRLINFNSPNFELYLKNLEELKKKLKNTKTEDEENMDELEMELYSNEDKDEKNYSKNKNNKKKNKKKDSKKDKDKEKKESEKKVKKKTYKQNKIQQQKIKKKKTMAYYFFKENILFAFKTSIILICFVSYFIVSFLMYKHYFNNFLIFDSEVNEIEDLYYDSFKFFLKFKSEMENYQSNSSYRMKIPSSQDIMLPNFGNILNDMKQKSVYSKKNVALLNQLYNGDMCLLLFFNETTLDYYNCKGFLSSILLKGMEQVIIQIGIMINNVIDELSLVDTINDFNNTVYGNSTSYKKYETFIEYYLLLSYLKNEEIMKDLRIDETNNASSLALKITIIYLVAYFILFIFLCYFIFMYKYTYTSLFNFVIILASKFILDDEFFYQKIIELERKLYK